MSEEWNRCFLKYLQDLGAPSVDKLSLVEKADVLASFAIRFEYSDGGERMHKMYLSNTNT